MVCVHPFVEAVLLAAFCWVAFAVPAQGAQADTRLGDPRSRRPTIARSLPAPLPFPEHAESLLYRLRVAQDGEPSLERAMSFWHTGQYKTVQRG